MDPAPTIDAMRTAARSLRVGDARERAVAIQKAQDALDAAKAIALAELEASRDFEIDGASTLNAWVRTQLRMNAGQATALVRSVGALRDLSLVAEAAVTGQISAAHVRVFVYGLAHVGLELMRQHEELFVQVAREHEPGELFEAVKHLKDRAHPDDLDDAWEKGMDKQDFQVNALPNGWHVTGFLNTITGAKLKKVLDSVSAPDGPEDTRSGSERRVQGLDDLLSSILGSGHLPSDKGLKPHVSVFADADTVAAAAERVRQQTEEPYLRPDPMPPTEPATLAGHGAIGPNLLMYFMCISEVTAFLMKTDGGTRQAQVLNAGTAKYQPNLKQRRSVIARQGGVCATPGCNHTHLEIHHVVWWSLGGRTDVDQLIGLCVRCHHLLHRGRLHIEGNAVDGFAFTNRAGRPLRRRRRTGYRQAA
ncbi:HNH endonuclease [Aeromicrobium wangtongii]|uniref:HNH endonuclease n=1 Tax=Aeromicrobium wangtongii TaxID=2969247 RepID=A0ABY5M7G8_9ACTN|nr:HNH endonuclease signature motif containing protein [Aeromicrobium wangtongii]MCD9199759.1 HNH endonuclease [Aeromicrobium wangtongii]UUP14108.1 HNH endonuclease [Aeromicrobium wangtongii]